MWLLAIPIAAIVVATFWSVTHNDFVNWDDDKNFINNLHYRGLGWSHLRWTWTTFLLGVYQPIAWMLLQVQYSIFGLDPWGYHLVSILLHITNSVVLYLMTIALIGRAQPRLLDRHPWKCFASAAIATTLFAVHPLRTEVVAWVSCQPYLPCALFYLLAIAAYLRANPRSSAQDQRWFWISYAFFITSLLSKAVAVSLPFVLLILDAYPLNRLAGGAWRWLDPPLRRVWFEKLPFIGASLAFMVVAVWAKQDAQIMAPVQATGLSWGRMAQALYGVGFYVVKTVVPLRISAFYVLPIGADWLRAKYVVYMLATVVISGAVFLLRRSFPAAAASWLAYLIVLSPNIGLVRIGHQVAADRYGYVPLMALFALGAGSLAVSWSLQRLAGIIAASVVPALAAALVALMALTQIQARTWISSMALWTHAVRAGQGNAAEVQTFLGLAFAQEGVREEAKEHYIDALKLNDGYADAHNNLGIVLGEEGRFIEAEEQFKETVRLDPKHVLAHNNLGVSLWRQHRIEPAILEFAAALELDPDNSNAERNLKTLLSTNPPADARLVECARAVLRAPSDTAAHKALKDALKQYN